MVPSRQERIGRHEVAIFRPRRGTCALVQISWIGDVSTEEASSAVEVYSPDVATGAIFVTDLSRLGKMSFGAIRALGGTEPTQPHVPRRFRLGFAVANLRTRVIVSIIMRAATFTSRDTVETVFFDSIEDAIAWGRAELAKV